MTLPNVAATMPTAIARKFPPSALPFEDAAEVEAEPALGEVPVALPVFEADPDPVGEGAEEVAELDELFDPLRPARE
jgi:hypothetical protein